MGEPVELVDGLVDGVPDSVRVPVSLGLPDALRDAEDDGVSVELELEDPLAVAACDPVDELEGELELEHDGLKVLVSLPDVVWLPDSVWLCEAVGLLDLDDEPLAVWLSLGEYVVLGVLDELAVMLTVGETDWLADGLPELVTEGFWLAESD